MATILVVDDEPTNRKLLKVQLGLCGHRVLESASAHEGLGIARAQRPDLMIVDIQMPNMDGYEFTRQVRSEPDICDSVIILSTGAYEAGRVQPLAEALGVRFVLTKPVDSELIASVVEVALGTKPPHAALTELAGFEQAHFRLVADKLTDKVAEVRSLSDRLTKLLELSLELNVDHTLPRLQEIFSRAGRDLLTAEFAAIGILTPDGLTVDFAVRGGDYVRNERTLPFEGLLRRLSEATDVVCLNDLNSDPRALGLPQQCGRVTSFLGIPVASRKRRYGWMYFAQKDVGRDFTSDDQQIGKALAAQLAEAYEHAALFLEVKQQAELLEARVSERTAELRQSHEKLERSRQQQLEMKDQFLAHVSHELRAPLAAAHLFLRNLIDGVNGRLTPPQLDDLKVVLRNVDQLRGMIGDLLETTRSDSGRLNIQRRETVFTEEVAITPVKNDHGIPTHFIAVKQDITERKGLDRPVP